MKNRKINSQIIIKFDKPFILHFSENPSIQEFEFISKKIQMRNAKIWGQKHLIPNYNRFDRKTQYKHVNGERIY
jgi:hypothetical protein